MRMCVTLTFYNIKFVFFSGILFVISSQIWEYQLFIIIIIFGYKEPSVYSRNRSMNK